MTANRLKYRVNIVASDEESFLEDSETFRHRCGEIFITKQRIVVLRCSICQKNYGSFAEFLEHISSQHYLEEWLDGENSAQPSDGPLDEVIKAAAIAEQELLYAALKSDDENDDIAEEVYSDEAAMGIEYLETYKPLEEVIHRSSITVVDERAESAPLVAAAIESADGNKSEYSETTDYSFEDLLRTHTASPKHSKKTTEDPSAEEKEADSSSSSKTQVDEKKYKCDQCELAFKQLCNLRSHKLRHTGEKFFKCSQCDKQFYSRSERSVHERRHTGERPFMCPLCGLTFISCGALTQHTKRHTNERKHKCDFCDKRFFDTVQLKDHVSVHNNEKKHTCSSCGSKFSRIKSLRLHMKLHENLREYQCSVCSASFNQKQALVAHLRNRHKIVKQSMQQLIVKKDKTAILNS